MADTLTSELVLVVEKPAAGGRMLARHDGRVVLVSGAIPGERVRACVERTAKGVIHAATVEVLEASADRRSGSAGHPCGGNVYAHIRPGRQAALKGEVLADALGRIGHLAVTSPIPVTPSPERGYRMRSRLHARRGDLGFFREGTHDLCDPASTGQLLPDTCLFAERFALAMRAARLDEAVALEIAENIAGTSRAVHLELTSPVEPQRLAALARVEGLSGLTSGPADVAVQARPRLHAGSPHLVDAVPVTGRDGAGHTVALRHHVLSFFQANRFLLGPLASRVVAQVAEEPVVDLYAGVGLFALSLAACGHPQVVAVEGDWFSADDLRANAAAFEGAVQVLRMPVEQFVAEAELPRRHDGHRRSAADRHLARGDERHPAPRCGPDRLRVVRRGDVGARSREARPVRLPARSPRGLRPVPEHGARRGAGGPDGPVRRLTPATEEPVLRLGPAGRITLSREVAGARLQCPTWQCEEP